MDDLPFLVVHGALVWPVLLAVAVALSVGALHASGKRGARRAGQAHDRRSSGLVPTVIGCALVWFGVLWAVGFAARRIAADPVKPWPPMTHVDAFGAAALAAAMPGARAEALDHLERHVDADMENTEAGRRQLIALHELRGECPAEVLVSRGSLEEWLAATRRCDTPGHLADALVYLGSYDEAEPMVDAETSADVATAVHIATGNWRAAAAAAERAADAEEVHPRSTDVARTHRDVAAARCMAALFRARAGEAPAFDRIRDHALAPTCAMAAAVTLPADQAVAALAAIHDPLADQLARAHGGALPDESWYAEPYDTLLGLPASAWLTPFVLATHPVMPPNPTAGLHHDLAHLALHRGDIAEARRQLGLIPGDATDASHIQARLAMEIALRDTTLELAEPPPAAADFSDLIRVRRGDPVHSAVFTELTPDECKTALAPALAAAQAGDGAPLAEVFRTCRVMWIDVPDYLLAVLPRVTRHREELARALRLYHAIPTPSITNERLPFGDLDNIVASRDLARLAGDAEATAAWSALYARRTKPLADRDRLIALLLWRHARALD